MPYAGASNICTINTHVLKMLFVSRFLSKGKCMIPNNPGQCQ